MKREYVKECERKVKMKKAKIAMQKIMIKMQQNYVKVKVKRKENYGVKFLDYLNHFFIFNEKGRSKLLNKVKKRKVRNKVEKVMNVR